MKGLFVGLSAIACMIVWIAFLAPLIANAFGVPCKVAFFRIDRQNQHLRRWQYFWWVGVIGWGGGMFLYSAMFDLLSSRILGNRSMDRSIPLTLTRLAIWLLTGMFYGYWIAPRDRGID